MSGMTMIIHQKFCQELQSKELRRIKKQKLRYLILYAVTDFQRSPGITHILFIPFQITFNDLLKIIIVYFN